MLLGRIPVPLRSQRDERVDQAWSGVAGVNDVVEETAGGCEIRMREALTIFGLALLGRITLVEDLDRALGAHHRDFRRRPRDVVVAADMLGVHDVVCPTVRLSRDHRELGDRRLAVRVEQLGAVLDDPPMLLRHPRQEPRHVLKGDDRHVEGVAQPDEARSLYRCVEVEHPGEHRGLIRDDPDRPAAQPGEAHQEVAAEVPLHLEEATPVHHPPNDVPHVVRLAGVVGDDAEQLLVAPTHRVVGGGEGRGLEVVRGQERQQGADRRQRFELGVVDEMRNAGGGAVHIGTAQPLEIHVFMRDGLHDVRTGHEHIGDPAHHEDEIGDRGTVHGPPGAGAEDRTDLRHDPRGQRVAKKNLGVPAERRDPFLDPRAAGIVQADDRRPGLHREIHHLADLLRVGLRERAAEHREVLREHVHGPRVNPPVARDDAVAQVFLVGEPEIRGAVRHEPVQLDERSRIDQRLEPLARGHLVLVVLRLDALGAAAQLGFGALAVATARVFLALS